MTIARPERAYTPLPEDFHARVVIADDDPDSRQRLDRILTEAGFRVTLAVDGADCVEKVERQRPQVIVLNWQMPRMDGLQAVQVIRRELRLRSVFIVLQTTRAEAADKIQALDAGVDDYLIKPFDTGELLARIRSGLRIELLNERLTDALGRLRADIQAASVLQHNLLPKNDLRIPPLHFAWEFLPAETMAGDLFGAFRLDERHAAIYLLDVSGHGVASAMLSVSLHHALTPGSLGDSVVKEPLISHPFYRLTPPGKVVERLNQRFQMALNQLYFTIFYAIVDLEEYRLQYCRAGQTPGVVLRDGEAIRLDEGDVPAGLMTEVPFHTHEFQMRPGDRLVLYSDAATDARNEAGEYYDVDRVEASLARRAGGTLEENIEGLVTDLQTWKGRKDIDDDLSLMAFEIEA